MTHVERSKHGLPALHAVFRAVPWAVAFAGQIALACILMHFITRHRAALLPKEQEQEFLLLGMLLAPLWMALALRLRPLEQAFVSALTMAGGFALIDLFFLYMDCQSSFLDEACRRFPGQDDSVLAGLYSYENEPLYPHYFVAGLVGSLLATVVSVAWWRIRGASSGKTRSAQDDS